MSNLIEISGLLVQQLTYKPIATASIDFGSLSEIVKFTSRKDSEYDPFDPINNIGEASRKANDSYFQRLTDDDRVKGIYRYLLEEINNTQNEKRNALGAFPTAIILAVDINEEFDSVEQYKQYTATLSPQENFDAFFKRDGKKATFYLMSRKNTLIVDGQHRLAAMLKLYEDASSDKIKIGRYPLQQKYPDLTNNIIQNRLTSFELNCTLLIGFDLWEQGKVFADVNFNQKPVNKSLYYDIFGSYPDPDKNDIFLAHMLTLHLNNNEDSVIKGFIKMLGRGSGYFSQAFFVEAIIDHFKTKGIWAGIPFDYIEGGQRYKELPPFFKAYFRSIRDCFRDYWPKRSEINSRQYKHILVKTTGMGALIKLINPIYRKLTHQGVDLVKIKEEELKNKFDNIFSNISDKGKSYFSKDSDYSGAGSLGLQSRLYEKLKSDLKI